MTKKKIKYHLDCTFCDSGLQCTAHDKMHRYDPFAHCGLCDTHIKCYKQEILQGLNCLLFIITGCLWNVSTFLFAEKGFLMIAHNADPGGDATFVATHPTSTLVYSVSFIGYKTELTFTGIRWFYCFIILHKF